MDYYIEDFMNFQTLSLSLNSIALLIRPHMEHSSIVWSPYLLKEKAAIEKVQHFALRVCLKDWSLGYDKALDLTRLPSLGNMWRPCELKFLVQHCAPEHGL